MKSDGSLDNVRSRFKAGEGNGAHADADPDIVSVLTDPAANLASIHRRVAEAAREAGRDIDDITVVAVTKRQDETQIRAAISAGCRVFGENRVQEAAAKWPALRAGHPEIELRLIGPLQSNKAPEAVALFDVIETVDRPKIARALAAEMRRQGRSPRLLIQVNTGEEPQKAGVAPGELENLLSECVDGLSLKIDGLMCIPPAEEPPAPHFALLAKLAARHSLPILSMGMSGDFETAIQLGATHVRLGEAIFGPRTEDKKPISLT